MNISVHLAVVAAVWLCLADAAPDVRVARAKQQRPTRGFKNVEMMTARGFGKRDRPTTRAEQYEYEAPARRKFNPKSSLMVAPDFGKRSGDDEEYEIRVTRGTFRPSSKSKILIARGYGKRDGPQRVYGLDNFWEMLEASPEREGQDGNDEKALESIPLDWFVNEMLNNPDFTRSVVRKFVDLNQDGQLTSDELLRNVV
ncbi:allatotropins-like [Ostrinia furnacalis]|uniref:allatotropins-like n=1 Tax=Ostrinia furnacalis TaxID=93504 RepID=UPI00103C21C5|nr:allatotropins-like [Ostrinia furnacalis]